MSDLFSLFKKDRLAQVALVLYLFLTFWWISIFMGGTTDASVNHLFGFVYGGFSIFGGLV